MGIKRTFYTESGFNLVPMAFPPMPFSKKNVLGTRLGVIVVDVYIADLLLLSQETWKILTPKGREEYDWTVSNHVHTFAGEDYWTRFLCFFCFDIVFIKSSKMPPDCCFFCFCFCFFCIYTLLTNVLHLISPFLTYLTIHPLSPLFHLYFYKHLYLRGWNFSRVY